MPIACIDALVSVSNPADAGMDARGSLDVSWLPTLALSGSFAARKKADDDEEEEGREEEEDGEEARAGDCGLDHL